MTDHRDELVETQRKLIALQEGQIAILRAYLKAAHEANAKQERTIKDLQRSVYPARKDVQA